MKKNRFKWTSLFLSVVLVFSLFAGCSSDSKDSSESENETNGEVAGSFTPGTYTAITTGMHEGLKVEVVLSADKIEAVTVVEHEETPGTSDPAIEGIPVAIVEHQSIGIDAVSGATITSNAILEGVADCIKQAGANPEDYKTAVEIEKQDIALDADIVVVGGGIAGLVAANEAADAGANVVLVEKMAALGGATITSGGEVYAAGTELQKSEGIEDSPGALAEKWIAAGEGHVNAEMLTEIANNLPQDIIYLEENGMSFTLGTPTAKPWDTPHRTHKTEGGEKMITPLATAAEDKGVTIITNAPVTSLIVEDGVVKGVNGTSPSGGEMKITAKNVILATGGFDGNKEYVEKYIPSAGGITTHLGEAHNGDALPWLEELNCEIITNDTGILLAINRDASAEGTPDPYGEFLYVNDKGERFMDESEYWFVRTLKLLEEETPVYYTITDRKGLDFAPTIEETLANGNGFKADSLEDLAKQIDLDPATLQATIEKYNAAAESGVDAEFGKDAAKLTPITEGPFYAIKTTFNSISGSIGGPKVNNNCQVMNKEGNVVEGLYAVGELANAELFYREYPSSGSSIATAIGMGRIAGSHATGGRTEVVEESTAA